jgi:hypothetical protein
VCIQNSPNIEKRRDEGGEGNIMGGVNLPKDMVHTYGITAISPRTIYIY